MSIVIEKSGGAAARLSGGGSARVEVRKGAMGKPTGSPRYAPDNEARTELFWTAPAPEDPDSMWMLEAYGDAGQLPAIGIGKTAEDALLTILEDLLPPGEES